MVSDLRADMLWAVLYWFCCVLLDRLGTSWVVVIVRLDLFVPSCLFRATLAGWVSLQWTRNCKSDHRSFRSDRTLVKLPIYPSTRRKNRIDSFSFTFVDFSWPLTATSLIRRYPTRSVSNGCTYANLLLLFTGSGQRVFYCLIMPAAHLYALHLTPPARSYRPLSTQSFAFCTASLFFFHPSTDSLPDVTRSWENLMWNLELDDQDEESEEAVKAAMEAVVAALVEVPPRRRFFLARYPFARRPLEAFYAPATVLLLGLVLWLIVMMMMVVVVTAVVDIAFIGLKLRPRETQIGLLGRVTRALPSHQEWLLASRMQSKYFCSGLLFCFAHTSHGVPTCFESCDHNHLISSRFLPWGFDALLGPAFPF